MTKMIEMTETDELDFKDKSKKVENDNSIIFYCSGAIDFKCQVNIELSLTEKEGFTKISPLNFISEFKMKHIGHILESQIGNILGKHIHISDMNEDIPKGKRFTELYYKCYKQFKHSHNWFNPATYEQFTLKQAIKYIKKENLDISTNHLNYQVLFSNFF